MAQPMARHDDKALYLLLRMALPASGDPAADLVLRLLEIRDAKGDVLDDDEFRNMRNEVIQQITRPVGFPWDWVAIVAFLSVGCLCFAAWCAWTSDYGTAILVVVLTAWLILIGRGFVREYRAKRCLSKKARLKIIRLLLKEDLISEDEANDCRSQIEETFPNELA